MATVEHSPGFLKLVESVLPAVRELDVAETQRRTTQGAILVDVREDREWEAGHARGAVHIGKGVIERDIEQKIPDADAEIVLYCGGGFRSALAADSLRKMGYRNVASMAGGWRAWEAAGGEVDPTEG
ncbi:MAG: rhodanese-like domain-containing protein [Gemmatimonadaceae bacterium]